MGGNPSGPANPNANANTNNQQQRYPGGGAGGAVGAGAGAGGVGGGGGMGLGGSLAPPTAYCCPISMFVMEDPVLCVGDNTTYERREIEAWLSNHQTRYVKPPNQVLSTSVLSTSVRPSIEIN